VKDVSEVTCAVIDSGLFLPMAFRMAEQCDRVIFCQACERTPCTIKSACIGDGFPNIDQVRDFWPLIDEIDLFCFPDVHHSGLQKYLESLGKAVWGCRSADVLELNRYRFMGMLSELGLDVPKFEVVVGLEKLRSYLHGREGQYVKVSRYRGDVETFHWRSLGQDEGWLDWLAVNLGPTKDYFKFLVFEEIETDLEIGCDTYCIDGQWPETMLNGVEWKDKSYFAAVSPRDKMPEQIKTVLEAFSPFLKSESYRQQWSMEVRVKDDQAFFIDATTRGGLPSTASQHLLWRNFPEIVWRGAHGELIEPEPAAQFSIECMVTTKSEKDSWDTVELPEELARNCRFSNCAFIDGRYCFPPDDLNAGDLGWLCAIGDSPKETLDEIKRLADLLPEGLDAKVEDLAGVLKEVDSMAEAGIPFSDKPIPEPAAAIE
jgi:hypothetical protein